LVSLKNEIESTKVLIMSCFSKPTPDFFPADHGFVSRRSRRFTRRIPVLSPADLADLRGESRFCLPQISQIYAEGRVAKNKKGGVKALALEQAAFSSIVVEIPRYIAE
jgi:hypothetical protein